MQSRVTALVWPGLVPLAQLLGHASVGDGHDCPGEGEDHGESVDLVRTPRHRQELVALAPESLVNQADLKVILEGNFWDQG